MNVFGPRNLRLSSLLVLGFGAFLLLWNLSYAPFWNPDEGRYAAASLEMARGFDGHKPDWIVPHLNTMPRLNKPPLVYWLGASHFNLFGANEIAGRLGSALFAIGVMLLVWSLARRVWGERCGLFAAMIWATSLFSFGMARVMNTDMLLCGAIALGCYGLWHAVEYSNQLDDADGGKSPDIEYSNDAKWPQNTGFGWSWSFVLAGVGMGLALLAKGPIGVVFPLIITFFYLLISGRWRVLTAGKAWLGIATSLVIAMLIAAPWYLAANAREAGFLKQFLFAENVGRFSGKEDFHSKTPIYFYLPTIIGGLMPWTPLLFLAFFRQQSATRLQRRTTIFLWVWAGLIVGLFSLSHTKLISYVLPAFPAFAILMAAAAHRVLDVSWMRRFLSNTLLLVNVFIIAVFVYLAFDDSKRVLDNSIRREEAMPFLLSGALILAATTLAAWRCWKTNQTSRAMTSHFVGNGLLFMILLGLVGRVAPYEDSSAMMQRLRPHLAPHDRVVQFAFQPTGIFYLERVVPNVGFKNTSGLPDDAIRLSPLFPLPDYLGDIPDEHPLRRAFQDQKIAYLAKFLHEGAYALVRQKDWIQFQRKLPPQTTALIIAQNGDFVLLSSHAVAGFHFDFVPPGKARRLAEERSSTR